MQTKLMTKLPEIALDHECILRTAEGYRCLVTYDSDIKCSGYIADEDQIVFLTRRNGYIRLTLKEAALLIDELEYILEDIERRNR